MTRYLTLVAVFALGACGGGTIDLRLMDAPPTGVTSVKVFVASMDVHVAAKDKAKDADPNDSSIDNDTSWSSLAVNKEIDLVQHQGETAAEVLGQLDLPDGKITQIRLHLDTTKTDSNKVTYNGADCALGLSKIDPKGIKISHPFKALETNAKIEAYVDVDLADSLKPAGSCFELLPVIKLHKVKMDGKDVQF